MERLLLKKLETYGKSDCYPLHMPGHKRKMSSFTEPYSIDITEIHGFDNLFHAEDLLLEAQQRAARLYGAEETFYLINGSTCGILAAISASVRRGGQILMARNCHKAAYHGVFLNGLKATYLYPSFDLKRGMNGTVDPWEVKQALDRSAEQIQAVFITSPTYDGVVSDVQLIAEMVHEAGAVLIVDEAHGAHFAMHDYFPKSALALGADIVINSLHKTMPSLTQTALLHVNGNRVNLERLKKYLGIYQSSSPSYVLMASMDACVNQMLQERQSLFDRFVLRLEKLRTSLSKLQNLHLVDGKEEGLHSFAYDRSKVIISTENSGINGPELGRILREVYHMEPEMEAEQYVTAIMTVADVQEGFDRLEHALLTIDRGLTRGTEKTVPEPLFTLKKNRGFLTIEQAEYAPKRKMRLAESSGLVSGEFVYLYPPGIPILVPGERIEQGLPEQIAYYQSIGLSVQGMQDYEGKYILVVSAEEENE